MTYKYYNKKPILSRYGVIILLLSLFTAFSSVAQVSVTGGQTASQLAAKLAGPGVTVFGATLTCPANAYGEFLVTSSTLGMDSGIVLTCGNAVTTASVVGVNITNGDTAGAATNFANTDNSSSSTGGAGDALLTTLTGGYPTFDACVLEFNFKPAGDTIKFKYVFGSEEYTNYTCTTFNDVFGFFITGGAFSTPTNLAKVPGTSIPVCINSVNCGPTGGGTMSTCTALGSGSPFCAYYVHNGSGTTITYDGLTTPLYAIARVSPCDTYHLKLGVADASDHALDSGVFLEAGSLTSNTSVNISAVGLSGLPYCVRGCAGAVFTFTTPVAQDTPIVIKYVIGGTAINGYDYSTIIDSVIIAPYTTGTTLNINPLNVSVAGTKVVLLQIQIQDPCHPGVWVNGPLATMSILDSFSYRIITPDTSICGGQIVNVRAAGDSMFNSLLSYQWTPSATVANDTALNTVLNPSNTTTYTLTCTALAALGCPVEHRTITVDVYHPSFDSVTFTNPTVCGYFDGSLTLYGLQTGFLDTVHFDKNGVTQPPMALGVSSAHTITINGLGAGIYDNIWVKVGLCPTVVKGPDTLKNPPPPNVTVDSPLVKTCVGIPVLLHAYASPSGVTYNYSWSPPTYLSSAVISNPVVNPAAAGDIIYTVTANPVTDPVCAGTATVHVHTLPPFVLNNVDTVICIGNYVQASITGSNEFSYLWTPATGVSSTTLKNPTLAPNVSTNYVVTASYAHCPDMVQGFNIEVDTPAHPVSIIDTICLGMTDVFDLTVPGSVSGGNYYHYQWLAPSSVDVSNDTLPNPVILPTTLGLHTYSVTVHPKAASCSITDVINIWVLPSSITVSPTDTQICKGKSVQAIGFGGNPAFTYQWIPTAGIAVSNVFNAYITPDTSALYTVTASFHRCPDIHATLNISVQPTPSVYIGGNRLLCQFDTLHIRASVSPAWFASYTYAWTPPADLDNTTSASVVFSGNATTKLYVNVTTPAGCTSNDSAVVTVFPGNFASMIPDNNSFCPHTSATLAPTGPAGVSYHWYPSLYLDDSVGSAPVVSPITSQVYTVIATSANGCKDTFHYTATVYPAAVMLLEDSVSLYPGESYHIQPSTNCTSFLWFPPAGLSEIHTSDPIASPQISTKYSVHGVTENGCFVDDSIDVIVNPESTLALPNAFTPGTGPNNEFKIIKKGIATLNYFRIFNRWGNLLFETTNIDEGWDGVFKGQPQPFGVYVYEVQAVTLTGRTFVKQGNLTLIR